MVKSCETCEFAIKTMFPLLVSFHIVVVGIGSANPEIKPYFINPKKK